MNPLLLMLVAAASLLAGWLGMRRRKKARCTPSFRARAREKGLATRLCRLIEEHARASDGQLAEQALFSREGFEAAAKEILLKDGQLARDYSDVEAFSAALGRLGLEHASDHPQCLRRTVLRTTSNESWRGVILTVESDKLIVASPPDGTPAIRAGDRYSMRYSGLEKMIDIPVGVAFHTTSPNGILMHLSRPHGADFSVRQHERVPVLLDCTILQMGDPNDEAPDHQLGHVLDLSEGGMSVVAPIEYGPNAQLFVALDLGESAIDEVLSMECRVIWSRVYDSFGWRHGVNFVGLKDEDRRRIREFLAASAPHPIPVSLAT